MPWSMKSSIRTISIPLKKQLVVVRKSQSHQNFDKKAVDFAEKQNAKQ